MYVQGSVIGANGSGKSNILDILKLVKELAIQGRQTTGAFAERGGYREVVWGGETQREIIVDLAWKPDLNQQTPEHIYSLELGYHEYADAAFNSERLIAPGDESLVRTSQFGWKRGGSSGSVQSYESSIGPTADQWSAPSLIGAIREWAFYRFNPMLMRPP
jgi:predicted ATPase